MNFTVFGLSLTSSWGNGHATLLRGLFRSLSYLGHRVVFFEYDTPYYSAHRDAPSLPFADIHLYRSWDDCAAEVRSSLQHSDVGIVTSYCPHASEATQAIQSAANVFSIFYDMDTPVTLQQLEHGNWPSYLPVEGLGSFDLVLSYTGGRAIEILKSLLKARRVEPLYGWVDPDTYQKTNSRAEYQCDLSYLGTYSADRQLALDTLLIEPARQLPEKRFIIAGAMYPDRAAWPSNVRSFDHVAPPDHASFYSSGTLTLNVTRGAMASMGYCPSGRLFEAAACRAPVMSDWWLGLDSFFTPGKEILIAENSDQAGSILRLDPRELSGIAARARERTLDCHTAEKRARRLLQLIESMPVGSDALRVCGGVS